MTPAARSRVIWWVRRDLRLADNPALASAASGEVFPLFVLDPALLGPAGHPRVAFLRGCLADLRDATDGALVLRWGDPATVVPRLVQDVGADRVVIAADAGPYGRRRDAAVADRLDDLSVPLERAGSPYAVAPGRVLTSAGSPFRVFTPFHRAWTSHGWPEPIGVPEPVRWGRGLDSGELPPAVSGPPAMAAPGERAAHDRLDRFLDRVDGYAEDRNRPDLEHTSRLSPYLRFGCLHPRQILAALGDGPGERAVRRELCWRDFYADVLYHRPESARTALQVRLGAMEVDSGPEADRRLEAWKRGLTGYPLVDAGMRQLRAEGWMHNRVRMLTASFLVKHLHLDWRLGAREFMRRLVDGDLASNSHGWQWTAGTGTDPAPFHRVFNPTLQAERFDPDGSYIRRYVPELRGLVPPEIHRPWTVVGGPPPGYPPPIVDHADARAEALRRHAAARG